MRYLHSKEQRKSLIIAASGLILLLFGAFNYYRVRTLSFSKVPPNVQEDISNLDLPAEIIIPSLNIDLKVYPGEIKNGVWQVSENNATFLSTSAIPGTNGNTVIYGHNKKIIFGSLPYLSTGQKITLITKGGKIFNYLAKEKYFVNPDRVDLVSPTQKEILTLYTCWGLIDSQRAVIQAEPIN